MPVNHSTLLERGRAELGLHFYTLCGFFFFQGGRCVSTRNVRYIYNIQSCPHHKKKSKIERWEPTTDRDNWSTRKKQLSSFFIVQQIWVKTDQPWRIQIVRYHHHIAPYLPRFYSAWCLSKWLDHRSLSTKKEYTPFQTARNKKDVSRFVHIRWWRRFWGPVIWRIVGMSRLTHVQAELGTLERANESQGDVIKNKRVNRSRRTFHENKLLFFFPSLLCLAASPRFLFFASSPAAVNVAKK